MIFIYYNEYDHLFLFIKQWHYYFGKKMNLKKFIKVKHNYLSQDLEIIENLPQIAITPEEYFILERPKNFYNRLIELINSAQNRIYICALYLQNDEAGQDVINAIIQNLRKNPNLDVRIYVDFHRAQRGLCGKGPQVGNNVWYREITSNLDNPPKIYGIPIKKREIFGVLHAKGFIFDDVVLYSGASINNVYLQKFDKYRIDRYHVIHSKELADALCNYINVAFHKLKTATDLTEEKIISAKEITSKIKSQKKFLSKYKYQFTPANKISDNQIGITPLIGLGKKNNELNNTIIRLLNISQKEVTIYTPYFNPPHSVLTAIDQALNRNVEITLIVGDKKANDFFIRDNETFNKVGAVPYLYELNLRKFIETHLQEISDKKLHIRLWSDENNTYHVKGLSIDQKYTLITGNNFNPRAWALDIENGLLIHDKNKLLQTSLFKEKEYILSNTIDITNVQQLQNINDYPENVKKIILRVKKLGIQWLLKRLL